MNPSLSKSYLSLLLQSCTYLFLFVTGDKAKNFTRDLVIDELVTIKAYD